MNQNEHIRRLEIELVDPVVRADEQRMDELLADDFREVGSAGKVYGKREVITALSLGDSPRYSLSGFQFKPLASDCVLVQFDAVVGKLLSRRCSVWVNRRGRWQMLYHQSTPVADG